MKYKYLSQIGENYESEEGSPGHRAHASTFEVVIGAKLKQAIVDLRNLLKTPKPGAPAAAPTGKSVKDLAAFHTGKQGQHSNELAIAGARRKVEECRRWLALQGVKADKDGNITDSDIEPRTVVYDHDLTKQGATQLHFMGGRLFTDSACRNPLNTANMVTHFSGPGKAIYVMSDSGNIHVSSHVVGNRHHSSLLAGGNVACGGELEAVGGRLIWLSNKSGHYRPKLQHLVQVLHQLQKKGVPMTFALTVVPGGASYSTVGEFLKKLDLDEEPDYELGKLLAYSKHLDDATLASKGWRWRYPTEKPGVYVIATNAFVPHKQVRTWLKSMGKTADLELQSGAGR